jgi:hypothetical protein
MSDFPGLNPVMPTRISIDSAYSAGGPAIGFSLGVGTGTWPTANLAIFLPLSLPSPFRVLSGWWINGGTVAGNVDVGVYGLDGSLIVSAGSTAQSGTNVPQSATLAETLLSPGAYYLAMSASSTSAIFQRHSYTNGQQAYGTLQAASQLPLATLPTFATPANSYQPIFGIASVTSI